MIVAKLVHAVEIGERTLKPRFSEQEVKILSKVRVQGDSLIQVNPYELHSQTSR